MRKKHWLESKFSWGFELEGLLKKSFLIKLKDKYISSCTTDSSVHTRDIKNKYDVWEDGNNSVSPFSEFRSSVFNSFSMMLKALTLFKNRKNYFMDESCGLHIHFKPKAEYLRVKIGDFDLIKKMQDWAYNNLCRCVKERIDNGDFCNQYSKNNLILTLREWEQHCKNKFVRNHPQFKTFEFRFFSPCEHKLENVIKFFDYFFKELAKIKTRKEAIIEI